MNKEKQKRQILRFLKRKNATKVDAFTIYQWIDRCCFEEWWEFAMALSSALPPNSLTDEYQKRVEYILSECRKKEPLKGYERDSSAGSCETWTQPLHYDREFSCKSCRLSIRKLEEMAELGGQKEYFSTFAGRRQMNIYKVDTENGFIIMRRSTGRFTAELSIGSLITVHNLIHSGDLELNDRMIDKLSFNGKRIVHMWGNYIGGLLRHLGCGKIFCQNDDEQPSL